MANRNSTVKDVLEDVREILNGISIPVSKLDEIGMPISRAIGGLDACIEAIERAEAAQKKEPEEQAEAEDPGKNDE